MLRQPPPADRNAAPQASLRAENRLPADVNPYAQWVHDHPAVLLPEPTPEALHARLAEAAAPGAALQGTPLPGTALQGTPLQGMPSPGTGLPGAAPLVVDLGCGSGNFLLEHARRAPQTRFVGFELRFKRLVKAARKMERAGLGNAWFLRETAERLEDYFAPGSLHAVHVNFPDPWPKRSDWKKRLVRPPLLALLERLLVPGGRFFLRTDHSGYFLHVLSLLPACTGLRVVAFSNDHHRVPAGSDTVRTEFEMLFQSLRKPVYSVILERPRLQPAPVQPASAQPAPA